MERWTCCQAACCTTLSNLSSWWPYGILVLLCLHFFWGKLLERKSEEHVAALLNRTSQRYIQVHSLKLLFIYCIHRSKHRSSHFSNGFLWTSKGYSHLSPSTPEAAVAGLGQAPLAAHLLIKAFLVGLLFVHSSSDIHCVYTYISKMGLYDYELYRYTDILGV